MLTMDRHVAYTFYSLPDGLAVCPDETINRKGMKYMGGPPKVIYGEYTLNEYLMNPYIAELLGRKELEVRHVEIAVGDPLVLKIESHPSVKFYARIPGYNPF